MKTETLESLRVSCIGVFGFGLSLSLSQIASLVSIAAGLSTVVYVTLKTYYLIKRNGLDPEQ